MGPAWNHVDRFYLVAGDLEFDCLAGVDVTLLNEAVALDDDELLPLAVMPVLALGDAGLADVDGDLAAVLGVDQLGEGAAGIGVHLQGILELLGREVGQVEGIEFLGKGSGRHLGHHEIHRLLLELIKQVHYLAQGHLVGHGDTAVAA